MTKKNKEKGVFDTYLEELKEIGKNAPEPEEILAQFDKGDYSSLDPEYLEEGEKEEKNKKVAKPKEPESTV